jgi:alpha-galactosidase
MLKKRGATGMKRIVFIGGGSVQWTPGLVNDIALDETLQGAEIVLYDIDADALVEMILVCKRIVKHIGCDIKISATQDRAEALAGASFVVLTVGIGGLPAMRNDLEIPEKYGIYQAVGDTVGPGGVARGMRHIPFSVELGREMEELCPEAWLLNLTNPMTTICRAVTRATKIRTIGLCHEVTGVQYYLADLFGTQPEQVIMEIAGINHLPAVVRCTIEGQDGLRLLQKYLENHGVFGLVTGEELASAFAVFNDQQAVKLSLFDRTGILYAAGDRHIAEFFPGFLTKETGFGRHYGVHLTTIDIREEMLRERKETAATYIPSRIKSTEQLSGVMAALSGGPAGQFIVNIPNVGQIDNLPRETVVECIALIDSMGPRPISVGEVSPELYGVLAPHVSRQELIVEAVLSGRDELGLAALYTDPLVQDPESAEPMYKELMKANEDVLQQLEKEAKYRDSRKSKEVIDRALKMEVEIVKKTTVFNISDCTIGELLENKDTRKVLEEHFPKMINNPQVRLALGMTLKQVAPFAPMILTKKRLAALDADLRKISD